MSSRVQKGGQKFKPVVKPRGRTVEASPHVSRKPPSARGATVEPFASHHTDSGNAHPPETYHSPETAFLPNDHTVSEQRDGVIAHDNHSGPRRKPPSSSESAVGPLREPSSAPQMIENNKQARRIVGSVQSTNAPNANSSPAIPVVATSRSRKVPSVQHSRSSSAARIPISTYVDDDKQSEPTMHSLMQGIAPAPVEVSQSHSEEAIQGTVEDPRSREDEDEELVTRTIFLTGRQSRPSVRSSKPRKKSNNAEGVQEGLAAADDPSHSMETRMGRKRRARKEAEEANVTGEGMQISSPEQTLRRSARLRRKTVVVPEAREQSDAADTQGSASESEPQSKRCRPSSVSTSRRRSRNPVFFDLDPDPGEDLDPTVVTMAEICDDTGQGRMSSKAIVIQHNHLAWKAANREKRERMREIMEAKKYGRKPDEEGTQAQSKIEPETKEAGSDGEGSAAAESSSATAVEDASGSGFNYKELLAINRFSARVRIGPNGETVIDEESLVVARTDNAGDATEGYQHVEESDQTKFTNSASYSRRLRSPRWSAEETELFYDALRQFGENFELISYVLPGRDRKACKMKFRAEDNKNPSRIDYCLKNRLPYDMRTLSRMTGRDFSGPPPEIRTPDLPKPVQSTQEQNHEQQVQETESKTEIETTEPLARKQRKRSKTPAINDDVEVVGDIETFDGGGSDS